MKIQIDQIKIGPRFRKDLGDIDELARSIEALGLLQPVVIDNEHRLVAGARRLEAVKLLGWTDVPVHVVDIEQLISAERDENEIRKDFTSSERVAIGRAIEESIGSRQGQRSDLKPVQCVAEVRIEPGQKTRDVVAKRVGFGNPETYRQAKTVVDKGAPELVEAMDKREVSISAAAQIAKQPVEEQRAAVKGGATARNEKKRLQEEKKQTRQRKEEFEAALKRKQNENLEKLAGWIISRCADQQEIADIRQLLEDLSFSGYLDREYILDNLLRKASGEPWDDDIVEGEL